MKTKPADPELTPEGQIPALPLLSGTSMSLLKTSVQCLSKPLPVYAGCSMTDDIVNHRTRGLQHIELLRVGQKVLQLLPGLLKLHTLGEANLCPRCLAV